MSEGQGLNDREQELREAYMKLWEARDASEGHRVLLRNIALGNGLDVFRGNHAELKTFLDHAATTTAMIHMWSPDHPYRLEYAQREASRLLHNYVAAAFSLVASTRRFVERHYANTDLLKEYETRVKRDFAEAPLHRFLQQLRNLTLHQSLPPTKAQTKFKRRDDGGQEWENGFWLNVNRLRERGEWTGQAREYLDSLGEEAKLNDIIDAYQPVVAGFHRWLRNRILEEHADAIEETLEIERRMKEAERLAYPDRGEAGPEGDPRPEPEAPGRALILTSLVGPTAREGLDKLATPDDVVVALYACLSYRHGGLPDLDRFRSLFLPDAQLVEVDPDGKAYLESVDGYITKYHLALRDGPVTAVSERETARRSHPLGEVAHVLSFHETRYIDAGEEKSGKGMYDLHMVKAGERWVITGMHLCHGYVAQLERLPRALPMREDEPDRGGTTD